MNRGSVDNNKQQSSCIKSNLMPMTWELTNGIGHEAGSDGDSPSKNEGDQDTSVLSQKQWFQGVVEAKIHPAVDENTNSRDGEASVETLDAVGLEGLDVHVDKAVELALATLALGVVSQPGF